MKTEFLSDIRFTPITPQRAFEDIAAQIRELVASGKLKPGDRLPAERELSAKFNVSRNTLREALRVLELAGMIELRKGTNGGAFVLPVSSAPVVNALRDLYHLGAISPVQLTEARIWLSTIVVRIACERMSDDEIALLQANVDAAMKAQKDGDFQERARLHSQFHVLLANATQNPIVQTMMEGVIEVLNQFIATIGPGENPYTFSSRKRFIKHLRARDADAAVAEMIKFLERLHARYLTLWNATQKA